MKIQKIGKFDKLCEEITTNIEIPNFLYHATYKPLLDNIRLNGLGGEGISKNWEGSENGIVYLAYTPEQAESYAETAEIPPDDWLDNIVVLRITTNGLDKSLLSIDKQNLSGDTLQYNGIIPAENIEVW